MPPNPRSASPQALAAVLAGVLKSAKVRRVSPEFVETLARRELEKGRSVKEAVKAVKNKLHQVAGAYQEAGHAYPAWLDELRRSAPDTEAFRTACRQAMASHASTRERLPILDEFYALTLAGLGPFHSVLDVACGLNPLAAPWMPLAPGAAYHAVDIYTDLMDFIAAFLPLAGLDGSAAAADVIESPPTRPVELALVLKTIPCLEQVDKTAGERLLAALQAETLLISFPARSLGGRSKGMVENYEARFNELAAAQGWNMHRRAEIQRFEFASELAFLVKRNPS